MGFCGLGAMNIATSEYGIEFLVPLSLKRRVRHPPLLLSASAKMLCVAGVHGERFGRGARARKKPHFCGKRKNGPPVVQIQLNVSLIQQADLAEPMPHGIILLTIFQVLSISIRMVVFEWHSWEWPCGNSYR